jgi:2',3'-cyclic-nucleotide 2'-phosphodiesterase (5'-nucleotidase family)
VNAHVPAFSRRRFLRALGGGALLATWPAPLLAEADELVTISLLHTTDLHGHILPTTDYAGNANLGGLARCATQIRAWRRANPHHLLVDIGDVFQGTELGLQTRGAAMIRCFNGLGYDAWVIGNHEFDFGPDALASTIALSQMPVLSGNARIDGASPLARIRPWMIKEVAGIRLALVSLTTPGLPAWIPPENLRGFSVLQPAETLRGLLREVTAQKPDAIILTGHMGLTRLDDFANPVGALTREFPQLTVFLGGHTHQDHSGETVNGVLYTQADHFGIHVGKVDLIFDRATRRLVRREAVTVPMDRTVALDPAVLSWVRHDLDVSDHLLAQPIGELKETFHVASVFGRPSDIERLIGSAMKAALRKRGVEIDAVVHGLFDPDHDLAAGPKIAADCWTVLPYENAIVTLDLSRADFLALARDFDAGKDFRNVMGVRLVGAPDGKRFNVTDLRAADGSPLPEKPFYRVALNAYDAQSGGERFLTVAKLAQDPANLRKLYPIFTRDALIDFFVDREKIGKTDLLV